jgi:MtrB/PioB family decaheme-associated outer membrane protein
MTLRSRTVEARRAILLASTVLVAAAPLSGAWAADQAAPFFKAPPPAEDVVGWYFFGGFEAGGRFFIEKPPTGFGRNVGPTPATSDFLLPHQTDSIAKLERFGEINEGPFLDWLNLNFGTKDGRYAFDIWARNVGLNNQSYNLDAAAIGQGYLTLAWDQTPNLLSTSAKSLFGGVGGTLLTVDPAVRTALQQNVTCANTNDFAPISPAYCTGVNSGAATRARIESIVEANANRIDLGTERDKATAAARWTPTDNWDVRVDYTHEDRTGTRPVSGAFGIAVPSALGTPPTPVTAAALRPQGPFVEVPQPIDDTTQNVNASGEWAGTAFWGTRANVKVGYFGSFYDQHDKFFDVQNPFCITCTLTGPTVAPAVGGLGGPGTVVGPNLLRFTEFPSNDANAVTVAGGTDVPLWKTRITSTFQYNVMRQNDPFIRTAAETSLGIPFAPWPEQSANAEVRALLWNTQVNSQFSPNVWNTLRFRIYDFDNRTPELSGWIPYVWADSGFNTLPPFTPQRTNLAPSYHKDRVEDEVKWRTPVHGLTVGVGGGWERWDRTRRDVDVTDEWYGKAFATYNATDWLLWRANILGAERRYDRYDSELFIEDVAGVGMWSEPASNMRRFDEANRDRVKGDTAFEIAVNRIVTLSPNAGFRWDDYPTSVEDQLGIHSDHTWYAGLDVGLLLSPALRFNVGYTYEDRKLDILGGGGAGAGTSGAILGFPTLLADCTTNPTFNPDNAFGPSCTWGNNADQRYHTLLASADWKAIPSRLDFRFEYLYSRGEEKNTFIPCPAPSLIGAGATLQAVGTNCNGLQTIGSAATTTLVDPTGTGGQFPTETNTLQRFSVVGRYIFDPSFVRSMGWWGDVALKVRYTFETNHVNNWQTDTLTPYVPTGDSNELTGGGRSLFLAYSNPNYTAQIIAASLVVKW